MTKCISLRSLAAVVLALGWAAGARASDTIESVEKELTAKWGKMKSMSADMETVAKIEMEGGSSKTTSTGTFEYLKKDDKGLVRVEMKSETVASFSGQEMKSSASTVTIVDGEYAYTVSEQMEQKWAVKMKAEDAQQGDFESQFKMLSEKNKLALLPEQTMDGTTVYAVEATPKDAAAGMGKMVFYYAKATGVPVKMVVLDPNGKTMSETTYSNVKINEPIKPERFVFKAPSGVQVMDMTGKGP